MAVLGRLQAAVSAMLDAAPTRARKAAEVARWLEIDNTLGWQVFRIAAAPSSLAVAAHVPARVSVEKLIKAAAYKHVPEDLLNRLASAFDEFEQLVEAHAGDRDTLDAILSAYVPDSRERAEHQAKEEVFRATRVVLGHVVEASVDARLLHPSDTEGRIDGVGLQAYIGLRRLHPEAHITTGITALRTGQRILTIDGREVHDPNDPVLADFCSTPTPRFVGEERHGSRRYYVPVSDLGLRGAVDVVRGDYLPAVAPRFATRPGAKMSVFHLTETPARRMTFDLFLHKGIPSCGAPRLAIYNAKAAGPIAFEDAERDGDRLRLHERVTAIPGGLRHAQLPHIPRYVEMLEFACQKRGWNPSEFRGFRLDVDYPVFGAQYCLGFNLVDPDASSPS